jgi:hypothetical protein
MATPTDVEIYNAVHADGTEFEKRVVIRLIKLGRDILNESDQTTNHTKRLAWAKEVLANPITWARKIKWTVFSQPTVFANEKPGSDVEDSDRQTAVENAISGLINTFAEEV